MLHYMLLVNKENTRLFEPRSLLFCLLDVPWYSFIADVLLQS